MRREMIGEAYVKLGIEDKGFGSKLQKDVAMVHAAAREMSTAEATIKINGDNTGYTSTMLRTKASLEAAKRALEAKKIKIGVETDVHRAKKELYELQDLLAEAKFRASINYHPAGTPGGVGGQRLSKAQIADNQKLVEVLERQVKAQKDVYDSLQRKMKLDAAEDALKKKRAAVLKSMDENTRRMNELETQAENNRIRSAKTLEAALSNLSGRKQKMITQEIMAAGGMDNYLEKLHEEMKIRKEANKIRQSMGLSLLPDDPRKEKNRFWSILTNSDNIRETLGKLMREPVKLGPFTATIKGLAVGAAALGPVLLSVVGTLTAMAGAVGGALTGSLALGTAALGGFGQAALGVGLIIQPMAKEFKMASQATNAYATAVAKYGKNSDQAKKKQEQMNSVLKGMSPTARAAYQDLAKVQTIFAKMTQDARPALDSALRGGMNFFRQAAPGFAKNSVQATRIMARGLNLSLDRLNSARNRGDDPLNTMFTNANRALGPLIQGMDYLVEAIIKIGASASRHLEPFAKTMRNAFVFKGLDDKNGLNKSIDGLMKDFYSVGGSIKAATRFLVDFLNIGRSAGRGLFDSLGSTFNRWDRFIKSAEGGKVVKGFFDDAAQGGKDLGNAITLAGLAFVQMTRVMAPLASGIAGFAMVVSGLLADLMKLPNATNAIKALGAGIAAAFVVSKIAAWTTALVTAIKTMREAVAAATLLEGVMTLAGGPIGLLVGGLVALGAYLMLTKGKSDSLSDSMAKLRENSKSLTKELSDASFRKASNDLQIAADSRTLSGLDPKSDEAARLRNEIAQLKKDNKDLTDTINKSVKAINRNNFDGIAKTAKKVNETQTALNKALAAPNSRETSYNARKEGLTNPEYIAQLRRQLAGYNAELEKTKNINAGQEVANRRALAPSQGGLGQYTSEKLQSAIGGAVRAAAGDQRVALQIALNPKLNENQMIRELTVAQQALDKGLPAQRIIDVITHSKSVDEAIRKLRKLAGITIPDKNANVNVQVHYSSNLTKSQLKTIDPTNSLGMWAEGGYVPAASGYTKHTAANKARRRPMRRAMGKFREPTFLVGEENRSEYVIATNPAYRRQNQRYLAQAADDLGMMVVPAAAGFSPSEIAAAKQKAHKYNATHLHDHSWRYFAQKRRDELEAAARKREDNINRAEALGFADSPASMSKAEKSKRKRLKTLLRRERDYKTIKNPSATRRNHHNDDVNEIRSIRKWIRDSVHIMSVNASSRYKVLNTELGTFDSRMSLAEKTGDTAAFTAAQKAQERNILELLRKDKRALSGARTAAQKSTIQAEIDSLNERLFDNRNKTIGGYAGAVGQAQVDQLNAQLTTARNEATINSMFGSTASGLGDILASGGPRRSGRLGAAPVININTLVPSDQATLDTINDVVVGAMSTQGNRIASGMTVG